MNNLDILKNEFKDDEKLTRLFYDVTEEDIDSLTPDDIVKLIHHDCCICLCYGCRNFTHNCIDGHISDTECENYIKNYFSRQFNPDTDNCQCPSCRSRRGEDNEMHTWRLSYQDRNCLIVEKNLPEAKSHAVNQGIYHKEDYPYIKGELLE